MKTLIEFNWRGKNISHFVEISLIFDNYIGADAFWGEFVLYGKKYEYQIYWNSQEIAIYNEGGIEPIDKVGGFQLTFSKNYK